MISLLLIFVFGLIAFGVGAPILRHALKLSLNRVEFVGHALALGLGIGSLGTFFLGLLGLYLRVPVALWWGILGILGVGCWAMGKGSNRLPVGVWLALPKNLKRVPQAVRPTDEDVAQRSRPTPNAQHPVSLFCAAVLVFFALVSLVNCFVAPGGLQWDAISYHLADQKIFIGLGRIVSLPTEHHSNFPLIADTLYGAGLMFSDFALSNLFSLLFGVATVCVLYGFCARTLTHEVGMLAVALFVTTPVVLWEFSVAYIDLAVALYTCASIFALLSLPSASRETQRRRKTVGTSLAMPNADLPTPDTRHLLLLSALEMGFALGCKYLALVPFGLCVLFLLIQPKLRKSAMAFAAVALVLAAPWFVRNFITMSNPVYPFAYSVFPSSKYWSADRAAAYQGEQDSFGDPHKLSQPLTTLPNLLNAPLRLLTHPERYSNPGEFSFFATAGIVFLLGFVALVSPALPVVVRRVVGFGVAQFVGWFFAAQVMRYVISFAPLFCVGGAFLLWRFIESVTRKPDLTPRPPLPMPSSLGGEGESRLGVLGDTVPPRTPAFAPSPDEPPAKSMGQGVGGEVESVADSRFPSRPLTLALAGLATTLLVGQAALALWGVARLPNNVREANGVGVGWSSLSLFTMKDALTDGNEAHLRRTLDNYAASEWVNQNMPHDAKLLLYDDVRGFYLDRFYVWADYNHSSWIDYTKLSDAISLTDWAKKEGFRYALVNLNQVWAARFPTDAPPRNREYEAFLSWYANNPGAPGDWRKPIYEAAKTGLWKPVYAKNGVIVLQIGETP